MTLSVALPAGLADNPRLDQWVAFPAPGQVTVRTGKVEIGQGIVLRVGLGLLDLAGLEIEQELKVSSLARVLWDIDREVLTKGESLSNGQLWI